MDYPPAICQPSTVGKVYLALTRVVAWNDCNTGGNVDITWNAGNSVPAGVYIVSIAVDGNVYSMKAIKK